MRCLPGVLLAASLTAVAPAQSGPVLTNEQQAKLPAAPPVPMPTFLPVLRLTPAREAQLDRDLMELDIPRLHRFYSEGRYTVDDVFSWYIGRIERYNGIYRALQTVDWQLAYKVVQQQDADRKRLGPKAIRGALWGVPVVIKANTAVAGVLDTDGWRGFALPGHEFRATKDATVVARLRAAGAIILGTSNMPDFAASDTNRSTAFGRTGNAYDVRFSPGGSSGGTVTAITANLALLGTGTDTANSIRMPAGTSSVVGMLPTRGLVSIEGIAPLDWLRDNTGPIARTVTDVAIALDVMAGEDAADFRTVGSPAKAQPGPYTQYLKKDALKGKRFGVPWFVFTATDDVLRPETRAMLEKAIASLKAAGADVIINPQLLPESFLVNNRKIMSRPYLKDGADQWMAAYGPAEYRTGEAYSAATSLPWPAVFTGDRRPGGVAATAPQPQRVLKDDPDAEKTFFAPQRASLAEYVAVLDRFHLDGLVYPSAQMPPPDETLPQNGELSSGPHSETGWVNRIGVPAIVVPAGFYGEGLAWGLPFGLEISARPWRDGDLLGWAYAFEQSTKARKPPVLVQSGLLRQW